ncbi:DUF3021 domain-containing protein [Lactobacillus xylocopicola]|uniref:DUF3021 domain-containing protein n=1 Tax=Lactobacillus xylocopicola TaxID=2976676 RepID=A0ABN6SLM3_9LACO|nr:DUF3021 domain-containing protein [Lactobacillus xylocopicola]BDR60339.1 hypothetical protein KIM322_06000 [Lactobacillus xylocopicola]
MKNIKAIIIRVLISAPIGVTIGLLLAISYSFAVHSTQFWPSTPQFVSQFANPVQATLAAMSLWALIGAIYGGSSTCFDQEKWSINKQTLTHFLITYILQMPIFVLAGWMPGNFPTLIGFTLGYSIIYVSIGITSKVFARKTIDQLNKKISK